MFGKRLATGGPLNELNELCGCNSRKHTVSVMELLEHHPTHDPGVLRRCIEDHSFSDCACGVRSTGPVAKFALRLFEAQFCDAAAAWRAANRRYTYKECYDFHNTLFTVAPLRGRATEMTSRALLVAALGDDRFTTRKATTREDFGCAVDYVVLHENRIVAGVQVKPDSAMERPDTLSLNRLKQKDFEAPVYFHVYSAITGEFEDVKGIADRLHPVARGRTNDDAPAPKRHKATTPPANPSPPSGGPKFVFQ